MDENNDASNPTEPEVQLAQPVQPVAPVVEAATPNEPAPAMVVQPTESTETPVESVVPTPTPVAVKSNKSPLKLVATILAVVALVAGSGYGAYSSAKSKGEKEAKVLSDRISVLEANTHDVPEGAIKVSECIPNMGSHYIVKESDKEYGPFLLVTKANTVIGVEYMAAADMYTSIPNTDPPVQVALKDSPMYDWKFDHAEMSHLPKGHEGLVRDHVDVHLYTVTPEEQKQACI